MTGLERDMQNARVFETLPRQTELDLGLGPPRTGMPTASAPPDPPTDQKARGAYFTEQAVADFLVRWAIGQGDDVVLDPSCGAGVFLSAAARRIRDLGGDPREQVFGVEIDSSTHRDAVEGGAFDLLSNHIIHADFFEVDFQDLPRFDAVIGNPPFIRYHRFAGHPRNVALSRSQSAGVTLSRLVSSWAPFLVYATQFVKPGGRVGMVAPAELIHAVYARPVLDHLCRVFREIRIMLFERRLFPDLSEDTVLVLAEGKGESCQSLKVIDLPDSAALGRCREPRAELTSGNRVDYRAVVDGRERLLQYLLPDKTRRLYQQLRACPQTVSLGDLADVGIGYVSGDNDFFHVGKSAICEYNLPAETLRPAVRSGSDFTGLRFTQEDWQSLYETGSANFLLQLSGEANPPESVQAYLREGERRGVPNRYKCRVRKRWAQVPHVHVGDAFLTYMSGPESKLVSNDMGAVAPNTLLVLRIYPLAYANGFNALQLASLWQTSLTALSCELEGHSLGGGMLKLEPSEAENVALAVPTSNRSELIPLGQDLDHLMRAGRAGQVRERADQMILGQSLGLTTDDVLTLRDGWLGLQSRRLNR